MTEKTHKELIEIMQNGLAKTMFAAFDFPSPNYSVEQLREVEDKFFRFYGGMDILPTTVIPFGFYLGETMIKNIKGAEWHNLDTEYFEDIQIKVSQKNGNSLFCKPFSRFRKFGMDETDRPTTLFWMVKSLTENTPEELMAKGEPLTDGWCKFPEGHMLRLTKKTEKIKEIKDEFDGEKQKI